MERKNIKNLINTKLQQQAWRDVFYVIYLINQLKQNSSWFLPYNWTHTWNNFVLSLHSIAIDLKLFFPSFWQTFEHFCFCSNRCGFVIDLVKWMEVHGMCCIKISIGLESVNEGFDLEACGFISWWSGEFKDASKRKIEKLLSIIELKFGFNQTWLELLNDLLWNYS